MACISINICYLRKFMKSWHPDQKLNKAHSEYVNQACQPLDCPLATDYKQWKYNTKNSVKNINTFTTYFWCSE
jgi:hypothetical protein